MASGPLSADTWGADNFLTFIAGGASGCAMSPVAKGPSGDPNPLQRHSGGKQASE